MQRAFGGYTLIEVMIFLAVSAVLLAVTIIAIRGQQAHTEFIAGVNDLNTKMQQWIDQVSNGLSGSTAGSSKAESDYTCTVPNPSDNNSQPQLNPVAKGTGAERGGNPQCIFLGKAIQFVKTLSDDPSSSYDNDIQAYTIIGRRTYTPSGGVETTVDNIKDAKPVAAYSGVNLTEDYRIPDGVKVKSVKDASLAPPQDRYMAGFFTNFSGETINNGVNGSISVIGVQYPLDKSFLPGDPGPLNCIELSNPCNGASAPAYLWPLHNWQICLQSSRSDQTALLTVNSSNDGFGVTTKLQMDFAC